MTEHADADWMQIDKWIKTNRKYKLGLNKFVHIMKASNYSHRKSNNHVIT